MSVSRVLIEATAVVLVAALVAACGTAGERAAPSPSTRPATGASTSTTTVGSTTPSTAAPATPPTATDGTVVTTRRSVRVGDTTRSYVLSIPHPLPAGDLPLVLGFHGGFGSGDQFRRTTRIDEEAGKRGFIAAFPDGTVDRSAGAIGAIARTWNAGDCCGPAQKLQVDDVAFFDALVDDIAAHYPVDQHRILVTGHSNGAMLAFRLACERADRIAAVAPVSGSLEALPCQPSQPVSLLAIHGDADQNHPIDGGRGSRSVSGVAYRPVREGLDTIAAADGCTEPPDQATDGPVTRFTWAGCGGGTAVQFDIVTGADHPWMGSPPDQRTSKLQGEPSQAIDATTQVLDFLLAHGR